jgi:hypothetical protein
VSHPSVAAGTVPAACARGVRKRRGRELIIEERKVTDQEDPGQAAEARLRQAAYYGLRLLSCEWRDGVLPLRGRVPSYYLKQLAQACLQGLAGVRAIDNQLIVTPLQGAPSCSY